MSAVAEKRTFAAPPALARPGQHQLTSRKTNSRREIIMSNEPVARTPGARRAAPGEYVFDLGTVQKIMGGPAYSTAQGPCVKATA